MGRVARGVRKYGPSALSMASGAYKIAKGVSDMMNTEVKYFDQWTVAGTPLFPGSNWTTIDCVSDLAQGYGVEQRIGNSIKIKSIQGKVKVTQPYLANEIPQGEIRILVIMAHAMNGIGFNLDEVLRSGDGTTVMNKTLALRKLERSNLYTVLYDKIVYINSQNTTFQCISKEWKFYKKLDVHLKFLNSGVNADSRMSGIYIGFITDNTVANSNGVQVFYNTRLRYIDN